MQRIAAQAGDIQVAGLARCVPNDIDRCWGAVKVARHPRIHVFLSTSPLHMSYKLRKDPEDVLRMAVEGVQTLRRPYGQCGILLRRFFPLGRGLCLPGGGGGHQCRGHHHQSADTVGYAQPEEYAALLDYVIKNTPNSDKAIFSVHCHNDLGLAVYFWPLSRSACARPR